MSTTTTSQQNPVCPECGCKNTVKKGKRRNRLQILQVFRCTECLHRFTGTPGKNKSYPLRLILETISTFNFGYSLTETQSAMARRFHRVIPERTISSWLSEYKPLTTYTRLRAEGKKLFPPGAIIRTINFSHRQVYRHQVHLAKLRMLLEPPVHRAFARLGTYVAKIEGNFPHQLFQSTEHRSSKFPADLRPEVTRKENYATRMAALVLVPLKFFKCGWFDEKDYFEFFPLKAVYPYTKVTTAPPTLFKGSAISKIAELGGR